MAKNKLPQKRDPPEESVTKCAGLPGRPCDADVPWGNQQCPDCLDTARADGDGRYDPDAVRTMSTDEDGQTTLFGYHA